MSTLDFNLSMHIVDFGKNFHEEAYMTLLSAKKIVADGQERVLQPKTGPVRPPILYLQTDQALQ